MYNSVTLFFIRYISKTNSMIQVKRLEDLDKLMALLLSLSIATFLDGLSLI
jgi:uncharacterized membrane protein YhaH (DUF805 family)